MKAYKIRIPNEEASRQVQEAAFSMGYEWAGFEKGVQNTQKPHLFFGESGRITWTGKSDGDVTHFNAHENEEIHWKDFIQLASKSSQLNKEDLVEGEVYYHDAVLFKYIIRFSRFNDGMIIGGTCICIDQQSYSEGYANTTIRELRKATPEEWRWLEECEWRGEFIPKEEALRGDSLSDKYSFDDEWLEQFLKEKGIKEKVLQRIAEQYGEEELKERPEYPDISAMFTWSDTPEGLRYWDAVNNEWFKHRKAMNKNVTSLNEESSPEAYNEAQDKCGLKVGDRVKVKGKTESNEGGWRNYWNPLMDKYVGKIGKITNVRRNVGVQVMFGGDAWHFPFFVLEKVEENEDQQSTYSSIDDCLLKRIQEIDWHVESSGAAGLGTFITKPSLSDSLKKAAKPKKKKKVKPRLHKRKPLF
jgi:hypothetical protein